MTILDILENVKASMNNSTDKTHMLIVEESAANELDEVIRLLKDGHEAKDHVRDDKGQEDRKTGLNARRKLIS